MSPDLPSSAARAVIRFADCELDLAARELRKGGEAERLQPKVFDLIAFLLAHRDRAVSKDELQRVIWPNVIVSEASLTQAIRKARQALGSDAEGEPIIRTVHGHGYRFVAAVETSGDDSDVSAAGISGRTAKSDWRPRVGVLPFGNLSPDAEHEYFSDAITQDLISRLSRNHWLDVLSRNSTFGYRDSEASQSEVAESLGADYVVTGSVRWAGERMRVSAELFRADTGSQIWAEHYDRDIGDVFAVQDEITSVIVARLEPAIGSSERRRVVQDPPQNLEAWHCFHLGVWHFFRFTAEDNLKAQDLLQRCRELAPNLGEAHAWWAYSVVLGMVYWDVDVAEETLDAALAATSHALELDDQNAVFYALRARVQIARREYETARAENEVAIDMNPSLAAAYCGLGDTLAYMNRCDEAVEQFERAIALSPNDPQRWAFLTYGALACLFKRDYAKAHEWAEQALVIPNRQYWTLAHRAAALAGLGRSEQCRHAVDALLREKPEFTREFARAKLFYIREKSQLDEYIRLLEVAGVP
ncbi:MAG: winged helix-turn-helix domain-containing protein [Gammaproteobacteria bacterium]